MFTPKTLEFLEVNHWMGSKEWFTEHKEEYLEFVQKPLYELSNLLAPVMDKIDTKLVTDPRITVSRIYRDMRFVKGGSPYRDMLWISFRRDKKAYPCWPEFYIVFSPREFFYGCGYYSARADAMEELRGLVMAKDEKFLEAKAVLDNQSTFVMEGDMYKRSRYSEYPEELRNWLDRKSVCFSCHPDIEELFAENLSERIAEDFVAMKPVYDLLVYAEGRALTV